MPGDRRGSEPPFMAVGAVPCGADIHTYLPGQNVCLPWQSEWVKFAEPNGLRCMYVEYNT